MADEQLKKYLETPETTGKTPEISTDAPESKDRRTKLNMRAGFRGTREKVGNKVELAAVEASLEKGKENIPTTSSKKPKKPNEKEVKKGFFGKLFKGGAVGGGIAKFGEFFKKIGKLIDPLRESLAKYFAPTLEKISSNNAAVETARKWGLGIGTLGVFPGLKLFMGKYADFYKGISRHKIVITDEKSSAKKFIEIYKNGVAEGMNDNFVDFFRLVSKETSRAKGNSRKVTMKELEGYAKKAVVEIDRNASTTKTPEKKVG